jgi:photosystem II stability/assembly factor-like uncharacterized protein
MFNTIKYKLYKGKTVLLSVFILLVVLFSIFIHTESSNDPRVGFDKPEGYHDYFKTITTPVGRKLSGYEPNYAINEYSKAVGRSERILKSTANLSWVERGPGNVGGRTRSIVIDPDDTSGNTWFAGSVSGGIWKTENGGKTWVKLTPDLPNLSTPALTMAASNTNVLYAGTGEGYGGEGMVAGNGIYKSVDKGVSWQAIETIKDDPHFRYVNKIWVSPTDENTLIAVTNRGIFRSETGGVTWDSVYTMGYAVQDIAQNPFNENVLYAGVNSLGVIKSLDGGLTWQNSYTAMGECKRVSLSVSTVDTSYIFAGVEAPYKQTHIYHSRNGGGSWQLNYNSDGLFTNFHKTQGWFNNVVAAHPFEASKVYVGGVNLGLLEFGNGVYSFLPEVMRVDTLNTASFMTFVSFGGAKFDGALSTGLDEEADVDAKDFVSVELRFGSGKKQKAHRFLVPEGEGAGVPASFYEYHDYVDVPFEVWDVDNNRQLMVSFRDQDRNGVFNLTEREYDDNVSGREYIFVQALDYNENYPAEEITINGGHYYKMLYFMWPTLPEDALWQPDNLPVAALNIRYGSIQHRESYTTILADDKLNDSLHVDHHDIQFFIPEGSVDYFEIVEANDGGIGFSDDKGQTWRQINKGYLTTQFYGMAKRPGKNEYIGGMQDNGTWQSPLDKEAEENSDYEFRIEGDGFETLWHPWYPQRILGSSYNNFIKVTNDFGDSWQWVDNSVLGDGPFITKLSHSRENPDLVFAVGSKGIYRHVNFGYGNAPWQQISLGESWAVNNTVVSSHHVKVSRANPEIVWAGGGMYSKPDLNIFVSDDYGLTFDTVTNYTDVELGYISGMETHPVNDSTAFLLFSLKGKPKVLRTYNLGQTWSDITGFAGHDGDSSLTGFPDVVVNDLLVFPNDTSTIWVGTEIGLFESTDNGATWHYANNGLPAVSIWQLNIVDDQILVATHGRGLWTVDMEGVSVKETKELSMEISVYPNPSRGSFFVSLMNPDEEIFGKMKIYNLSGQLIYAQEIKLSVREEVLLNNAAPGNYIIIFESESTVLSHKLIIQN